MASRFSTRSYTIKPEQGGALINVASHDNVGEANYVAKWNLRRFHDREVLREGWSDFLPVQASTPLVSTGGYFTLVAEALRANGDRMLIAATPTTIWRYNTTTKAWVQMATGYDSSARARRWEAVNVNGFLVLNNGSDLPVTIAVGDTVPQPIHELRERGVASVGTICEYYGFLHCFDVRELIDLNAWMNGATPYGRIEDDALTNRFRYRHIWSEYGQPRNWAPVFTTTLASSTSSITLPFPSSVFVANQTKVAVIGGGINGGTLGGGLGTEEGVLVTAVAGAQIALAEATAAGITYPRTVQVTRFADTSSIVGYNDMIDDGSAIIKAKTLRDSLVIYRETGAFVGRYTAVPEQPFVFRRVYQGDNVPYFRDTVSDLHGEAHIYAGRTRFFTFDGVDEPKVFPVLDQARANFLVKAGSSATSAFAVNNPLTREIWFCTPTLVLAYDYEQRTASEIDMGMTAAAAVVMPNTMETWFAVAVGGTSTDIWTMAPQRLQRYGGTFMRNGSIAYGWLRTGLTALGDEAHEKAVMSIAPHLGTMQQVSSTQASPTVSVKLFTTSDPTLPSVQQASALVGTVQSRSGIPVFSQATYFAEEYGFASNLGTQIHYTGRTLTYRSTSVPALVEQTRQEPNTIPVFPIPAQLPPWETGSSTMS